MKILTVLCLAPRGRRRLQEDRRRTASKKATEGSARSTASAPSAPASVRGRDLVRSLGTEFEVCKEGAEAWATKTGNKGQGRHLADVVEREARGRTAAARLPAPAISTCSASTWCGPHPR